MAPTATSTAIFAVVALFIPISLVFTAPTLKNDVLTPSSKSSFMLPKPLDVHVVYVKDNEYKLIIHATPEVTDVTTTVSLNKVVTEVTDDVEVLHLTKQSEGDTWTSPPIKVKLSNKDVLHLGVHFVQEGKEEMQTVNSFENRTFDSADKLQIIINSQMTKETSKSIKKRAAADSSDDEEAGGMSISMAMAEAGEDSNRPQLSERFGAHGGYYGNGVGGRFHGNSDFIQIPFAPVKIPSPTDSAFGLFGGLLGGGNRDQDRNDGPDRYRPQHRPNWGMHEHYGHGSRGHGYDGSGHNHNHGHNGRYPDRHRPHNHNCNHDSDENSNEDDSYERPATKRPLPPTRSLWTTRTTPSTTRYPTRRTTTTTDYPDIDIRFGKGETTPGTDDVVPKPDSEIDLPPAV